MELSHNVTITVPRFRDSKRVNTQTQLNTRTNTMMNFTFTNTNSMAFNVVATYNALFISIFPFVPFISTILLVAANFYCISFFINIFALAVSSIIFSSSFCLSAHNLQGFVDAGRCCWWWWWCWCCYCCMSAAFSKPKSMQFSCICGCAKSE